MVTAGCLPRQAVVRAAELLRSAGCPDAALDARRLVQLAIGADPRLCETPLTEAQSAQLNGLLAQRANRVPLQYLCGSWDFLDFSLKVGPGVLCPRADTEIVAEAAAETLQDRTAPVVLDLCAGTGCLGLGVKRFCPQAQVTALEKSPEAFAYLEQNAAHALDGMGMGPAPYLQPVQGDLFTFYKTQPQAAYDLIVSNPPYLTAAEMTALQPEVRHEPAMALAAGADGLDFYRAIAEHYKGLLRPGGWLVLEIGWQQRQAVTELLARFGWTQLACRKDYAENDRCILAQRPE